MCQFCEDNKSLSGKLKTEKALIKEMAGLLKIILPYAEGEHPIKYCYAKDIRLLLERAERSFQ